MATAQQQAPPAAAGRYEAVRFDAVAQQQLARACRRIRLLDLATRSLGLAAVTLAFALAALLLDWRLDLSRATRQLALLGYGVFVGVYLAVAIAWPLCRRINPYYAARAIERVLHDAKNSIVNWLDLHDKTLPPAIHNSLSQRAAQHLAEADLEQAISARRVLWLCGVTLVLFLAVFVLMLAFGVKPFVTFLGRTFVPFGSAVGMTTRLEVIRPANGDAVVAVGHPVPIAVRVEGRVPPPDGPDALKLLFRYRESDPYEEQLLEPEGGDVWATTIAASQVHNGFLYKVVGGNAETPEYRITARSVPLVTRFEVTYRFRPYLRRPDQQSTDAHLRAWRGTEVTLVVRTNRALKAGRLELEYADGKQDLPAELLDDDPQAMRFRLVIDRDGRYRVWFTSTENERNTEPMPYSITALPVPDRKPEVTVLKPGDEVEVPANGTLRVEGLATDDYGIAGMTLRLRQTDGPALQPKVYREGKSFQFADGSYPTSLEYKDFVALDQVKDEQGRLLPLAGGMVLEGWLEAVDNCDYPGPNKGESRRFKVKLTAPLPPKQQQEDRAKAAEEQKEHEAKQDSEQQAENQARQQDDEELERKAQQLKDALEKAAQENKGEGKGDPQDNKPGEGKGEGKKQATKPGEKGDKKDGDKGDGKGDAGSAKEAGMSDGSTPGEGKNDGNASPDMMKGDAKGGGGSQHEATAKPDTPNTGDVKSPGKDEPAEGAGEKKDHGAGMSGAEGEAKGPGQESGTEDAAARGQSKGVPPPVAKGETKQGSGDGQGKGEGHSSAAGSGDKAGVKSPGEGGGGEGMAKAEGKGDGGRARANKPEEVARLEKDLQSGDEQRRDEAARKLEEMSRSAAEPQLREAAKKALDEDRQVREASPSQSKAPPKSGGPLCAECKGGGGASADAAGAGKGGGGPGSGADSGMAKGGGEAGEGSGGPDAGTGFAKGASRGGGGQNGARSGDGSGTTARQDVAANPPPGTRPDPRHRRAGVLQLEDFSKIDKNILKDLGMTEAQFRAFRKAYTEKVQRHAPEKLPGPQSGNLSNVAVHEVKGGSPVTNEALKTGQGQAPREFRELFRKYTSQK